MKSIYRHKNKKPFIILAISGITLLVIGVAYLLIFKPFQQPAAPDSGTTRPVNDVDYSPATDQEKQDSERAKEQIIKDEQAAQQPTSASTVAVTISRAGQNGSNVEVRTLIDGAKNGDCTATFTHSGASTVAKSAPIAFEVSSYTCNLNVPTDSFASSGDWNMSIVAKSGNISSSAATQQITINK